MANYVDTNLEPAVARFVGGFEGAMNRTPFTEFLTTLLKNGDYLFPEAESIKESSKRTVKAKIRKQVIEVASGARSCTLSGSFGDGATATINWTSLALTGKVSTKQHQDNEIKLQEAIAGRIADLRKSVLKAFETQAQAWFAANRSTINAGISYGTFNAATNVFEIDPADAANPGFLNIAEQVLGENQYRGGMYEAVVNGFTYPQLRYQSQQGAGNSANLAFQFGNWLVKNGLGYNDVNYPNWFAYIFQEGMVGALNWLPADYRSPREGQSVSDTMGVKMVMPDPEIMGLNWAVKTQLKCEDTSLTNGGDDDEVLYIQLSTDLSFNYAPTANGSTPIFAIASANVAP